MMDAKRALEEAGGDMSRAADILREKGNADAAKRSGRAQTEGRGRLLPAPSIGPAR